MNNTVTPNGFVYKDSFVVLKEYSISNLPEDLRRKCFCCGNEINDCSETLLINNQKYIPNTLLHKDCFVQWSDRQEQLCEEIASTYDVWKQLNAIFGSRV